MIETKVNIKKLTESLLDDMELGGKGMQPMITGAYSLPEKIPMNTPVIVIDAGGTNFRSSLVTLTEKGPVISDLEKTFMPGSKDEKPLSKDDFFEQIAANLDHLKNKASYIGFCFSYQMSITPDGDGIIQVLSKGIKVRDAKGCYIGKELKLALEKRGWSNIKKISLVNDTTAALLSGFVSNQEINYSSYIGFILGTGMNNAFIQNKPEKLIKVCESGQFIYKNHFCEEIIEKYCSGKYLPVLCFRNLLDYANKYPILNSSEFFTNFVKNEPNLKNFDEFLQNPDVCPNEKVRNLMIFAINEIYVMSAKIAASVLLATILKCDEGKSPEFPVCIVCNGTTFWKTNHHFERITAYLDEYLTGKWKRFYKIIQVENDITIGTYVSAFL